MADDLAFGSEADLRRYLNGLLEHRPMDVRSQKEHDEGLTLCRLLPVLAHNNRIAFPITINPRDHPDFKVVVAGRGVGIEVTVAQDPRARAAEKYALEHYDEWSIDTGNFRYGQHRRRTNAINVPLFSEPYEGDEVEEEWASYVYERLREKAEELRCPHFENFDENWLVIRDATHLAPNLGRALVHLSRRIDATDSAYDATYILSGPRVYHLVGGSNHAFQELKVPSGR